MTDNITTATTSKHCIDLVATDQPNIIIKNEVAPSLHSNCSHQINFVKLDLKSSPSPPYKRNIFPYARANGLSFRESLFNFDWANQLELLSPSDQVELLDSTISNVAKNSIPNNEKTFTPRYPPWITKAIKTLSNKYYRKFPLYAKRGFKPEEKKIVNNLRNEYTDLVTKEKENYLSKLGTDASDPRTARKK